MMSAPNIPNTAAERAQAVAEAFSAHGGSYHLDKVAIVGLEAVETPHGHAVKIQLRGRPEDDPIYVVNPPLLALDPNGDIRLGAHRFRHDPMAAVVDAIKRYGGIN